MSSNLERFNQLCNRVDNDNFSYRTWKDEDECYDEYDDQEYESESDDDEFFGDGVSLVKVLKDVALMSIGMDPVSKYVELVDQDCELDDVATVPVVPLPVQAYIFACLAPVPPLLKRLSGTNLGTLKGQEDVLPLKSRIFRSYIPGVEGGANTIGYDGRSDGTQLVSHGMGGDELTMKLGGRFCRLPRWMFSRRIRTKGLMYALLFLIVPGISDPSCQPDEVVEVVPTGGIGRAVPRVVVYVGSRIEQEIRRLPESVQSHIGPARDSIPVVGLPPGVRIGLDARRRDGEETVDACTIS